MYYNEILGNVKAISAWIKRKISTGFSLDI